MPINTPAGIRAAFAALNFVPRREPEPEPAPQPEKTTFLDRVKAEHADLSEKITKLSSFLDKGAPGASYDEVDLLVHQLAAMQNYSWILTQRINLKRN